MRTFEEELRRSRAAVLSGSLRSDSLALAALQSTPASAVPSGAALIVLPEAGDAMPEPFETEDLSWGVG